MSKFDTDDYYGMLLELQDYDPAPGMQRLTSWEIDFLDSLEDWDGKYTDKQCDALERIYRRIFE